MKVQPLPSLASKSECVANRRIEARTVAPNREGIGER